MLLCGVITLWYCGGITLCGVIVRCRGDSVETEGPWSCVAAGTEASTPPETLALPRHPTPPTSPP